MVNGERRHRTEAASSEPTAPPRRTQAERSQATRGALLAAARELLAERGYAGTGREDIAERAGVTRGALYHHFASKEDLFRAVVEELEQEVTARVAQAGLAGSDPLDQLRRGSAEYLDAAMDPAVQRILLLDAPAVLGWQAYRELEARYALGLVIEVLEGAMSAGQIDRQPVQPLAHMLLASLTEAAMLVAGAAEPSPRTTSGAAEPSPRTTSGGAGVNTGSTAAVEPAQARREVGTAVDLLIDRLARR